MFFFGKKKKVEEVAVSVNKEELLAMVEKMEEKLPELAGEERIKALNELGSLYFESGEIDKAILSYETSLKESKVLGKAYTDLIKLYNSKRRTAAENKDEAEVKEYMDKIDELMTLSKDVIRGKV